MKAIGILSLMIALGIGAYITLNQQKSSGAAPGDNTAKRTISKAKRIQAKAMLVTVSSAIRTFEAQNERLPESLDELESEGFLDRIPQGLDYDPESGEVSLAD